MSRIDITDEELSGPKVDRRTTIKLLGMTGMGGMAGLAGCAGDDGQEGTETETEPGATDGDDGDDTEDTETQSNKYGGRLQAGWNTGEISQISPTWITIGINAQVMANIHNALVQTTPNLEVVPDLAKDWTVENQTKYTFELREGVKFHNGDDFTAEDVRYTIQQIFEQDSPIKPKMSPLEQWDDGGVVVVDDYTVELNFKEPYAPAITTLARGDGRGSTIISKTAVEEMGWDQYKLTPVGTGPFQVDEHNVGSLVKLDKFDDYFQGYWAEQEGNDLPYLDGVDIKPIPEPASRVNALRSGDIHFMNFVPLQNLSTLEDDDSIATKSGPGGGYIGLVLNGTQEKFHDPKVRLGISKMVDQEAFVESAYFGNEHVADGPIGPIHGWAFRDDKPDHQAYAPEEGKQMLQEADAWPPSFSIMTDAAGLRGAKAMRQMLNEQGFDVEVDQVTSSTASDRLRNAEYETTMSGNAVDLDPDPALRLFFMPPEMGGSINFWGYDPRPGENQKSIPRAENDLIDLFQEQLSVLNRDERKELWHEIEDIIIEDAPFAFTHHTKPWFAYRNSVKGYLPHGINRDFHTTWLDE